MQDYERFMSKVDTTDARGCWPWLAKRYPKGYGAFWYQGRWHTATHYAWLVSHGSWPTDGLRVLHHCDNPPCVRPSHLFLGTPLDNMRDMIAKGRARHPVRYGMRTWSKLTEADVRAIREAYEAGGVTQQALSEQYGVSRRLVGGIVKGKRWVTVV